MGRDAANNTLEAAPTKPERAMKTRERLLLTAERLIAEEGVGQVSMRRINAESGARNLSAIHYHFGSLEGVISAIYDYRMTPVERRRSEMLNVLLARTGRQPDVEEVLRVVLWPLVEMMLSDAEENNYVRFLAAVNRVPQFDGWEVVSRRNRRSIVRCYLLLRRKLSQVLPDILHLRIMMGLREMFHVLADVDHIVRERHPSLRDPLVMFHANELVTKSVSALQAPVGEETQRALSVLRERASSQKASIYGVDSILVPHAC